MRIISTLGMGVLLLALITACGDGSAGNEPLSEGESHWLTACESTDDCPTGSCLCGICTLECAVVSDCAEIPVPTICVSAATLECPTGGVGLSICVDPGEGTAGADVAEPDVVTPEPDGDSGGDSGSDAEEDAGADVAPDSDAPEPEPDIEEPEPVVCSSADEDCTVAVCTISGSAGETVSCPLRVARGSEASPVAVAIQIRYAYDETRVSLEYFDNGEACPVVAAEDCPVPLEAHLLPPESSLQSGHAVAFLPAALPEWDSPAPGGASDAEASGHRELVIASVGASIDLTDAIASVSDGGQVTSGSATVVEAVFVLDEDIPADNPVLVRGFAPAPTDGDALVLDWTAVGPLIITGTGE